MRHCSLAVIVVALVLFLCACSSPQTLSPEKIELLREKYPVIDLDNTFIGSTALYVPREMKEIEVVDWVRAVCVGKQENVYTAGMSGAAAGDSGIAAAEEKTGSTFSWDHEYVCYRMTVKDSYLDVLPKESTFPLLAEVGDDSFPSMETGSEYMIGLIKPLHSSLKDTDYFGTIFDYMFYVTDTGYVLSVSNYDVRKAYSGITVNEWAEKVRAFKEK